MNSFGRSLAVIVGIDRYENGIPSLHTAVNDARALRRTLRCKFGYETWLLLNRRATLGGLRRLLESELPGALTDQDRLLFYFAGHGISTDGDGGPVGFVIPQDARQNEAQTFLPMTELHDALVGLPCRHLLVILDCCFAGAFRWASPTRNVKVLPERLRRERYERFVSYPAKQLITSTYHNQKALDVLYGEPLGARGSRGSHSPFARSLLEALGGAGDRVYPASDGLLKGDNVITATELYSYLRDTVEPAAEKGNHSQTPGLWPLPNHDRGEYVFLLVGEDELKLEKAPALTEEQNPYRGLKPFGEEDEQLFFGRAKVADALEQKVRASPLTVVVGASGTGKSSLVKAGLFPRLHRGGREWELLPVIRPGGAPLEALAKLRPEAEPQQPPPANWGRDATALAAALGRRLAGLGDAKLVLVVDQLEELVTVCQEASERTQFLRLIDEALAAHAERLRVIYTVRSDFETRLSALATGGLWDKARFIITPMTREEYREVIVGPAAVKVLYFEPPSLVEKLLDEVVQMPGALPLLSFTLSEMYVHYVRRGGNEGRALEEEDYQLLGGVIGSLRHRADAEYGRLGGEGQPAATSAPGDTRRKETPSQATMRRVMLRMVSFEGGELARRRLSESERDHLDPAENERVKEVVNRLQEARLLVGDVASDDAPYVEPAHDALVRGWDRLGDWMQEEQDRLPLHRRITQATGEWKKANDRGLLWHNDPRLPQARKQLADEPNWLNKHESGFVSESIRQKRNDRLRLGATVVAAVIIFAVSVWFLWGIIVRETSAGTRQRAERLYNDSHSEAARQEPQRAMLLAGKALETTDEKDSRLDTYKLRALHLTAARAPLSVLNLPRRLSRVRFSPDRGKLVGVTDGLEIEVWDVKAQRHLRSSAGLNHTFNSALVTSADARGETLGPTFSPDGTVVAALLNEKSGGATALHLVAWKPETGETLFNVPAELPQHEKGYVATQPRSLSFTADGSAIVVSTLVKTARYQLTAFDSSTGRQFKYPAPVETAVVFRDEGGFGFPLSPDAGRNWAIVVTNQEGRHEARVVDVKTGLPVPLLGRPPRHKERITSAVFSGDGGRILTATRVTDESSGTGLAAETKDIILHLWDVATGTERLTSPPISQGVVGGVSRDGMKVLLADEENNQFHVWSMDEDSIIPTDFVTPSGKSRALALSEDGAYFVTSSANHTIEVWDSATQRPLREPLSVGRDIIRAELSKDGRTLQAVSPDGSVTEWDLRGISPQAVVGSGLFPGQGHDAAAAAFSPDRKSLLILSSRSEEPQLTPEGEPEPPSEDREWMQLWDVQTLQPRWPQAVRIDAWGTAPPEIRFSGDGRSILLNWSVRSEGVNLVQLWDASSGKLLREVREADVEQAAVSKDSGRIVGKRRNAQGWRVESWPVEQAAAGPSVLHETLAGDFAFLDLSRHGDYYLFIPRGSTAFNYTSLAVWDSKANRQVPFNLNFESHEAARLIATLFGRAEEIKTAGDGLTAVLGPGASIKVEHDPSGGTGTRVYDVTSGQPVVPPAGSRRHYEQLFFSDDARWIVTWEGKAQTAQVWEARSGLPVTEELWHKSEPVAAAFSADRQNLLTLTRDGVLRSWPIFFFRGPGKPAWLARAGEILTGSRWVEDGNKVMPTHYTDYPRQRADFFSEVRRAAQAGDAAAEYVLRRWAEGRD